VETLQKKMDLRGQRALITGATGCLGQVIANTLAELGADLLLLDRDSLDLKTMEQELSTRWGIGVESFACDLELEQERIAVIESINGDNTSLNIVINNAAFVGAVDLQGWVAPFELQTLKTWRRAMEVNLTAAFHLSQAFIPKLKLSGGNIINITSIYGEYAPDWRLYQGTDMGNPAAYASSKAGLCQLTRWLATTVAPEVRVNAISPGGIYRNQPTKFVERYEYRTPLGRMATEDDFSGVIAFLASNMSRYVTGQVFKVDGGWGIW